MSGPCVFFGVGLTLRRHAILVYGLPVIKQVTEVDGRRNMLIKPHCMGILGFILGHKYEAVYDVKDFFDKFPEIKMGQSDAAGASAILLALKTHAKTCRAHVCIRCGDTVIFKDETNS
jgi:hypothetical protein